LFVEPLDARMISRLLYRPVIVLLLVNVRFVLTGSLGKLSKFCVYVSGFAPPMLICAAAGRAA
jgi:hypothetical protein